MSVKDGVLDDGLVKQTYYIEIKKQNWILNHKEIKSKQIKNLKVKAKTIRLTWKKM